MALLCLIPTTGCAIDRLIDRVGNVQTVIVEQLEIPGDGVSLVATSWREDSAAPRRGPLVLLHGGGQTRHSWSGTGPSLARMGFDVISVDARGHGDSEWAPDGFYGVTGLTGDLRAVVDWLGAAPVLIGASMGGLTGLATEGNHPGTLRALVLVDVVARIEPAGVERIITFMRAAPDGFASLHEVAASVQAYQPQRTRPVDVDSLRKNVRQRPDGRWRWHWDPAFVRPGNLDLDVHGAVIAEAAGRVRVPTLIVRGGDSDVVGVAGVAELMDAIPGCSFVEVPGAAHMVAGDDNSQFLGAIMPFLLSLPPTQPPSLPPTPATA